MPERTFIKLKGLLWEEADEAGWTTLTDQHKSALYEKWIRRKDVGGVLSRYPDFPSVRVYIKDTVMKPYGRERLKDAAPILDVLGLEVDAVERERFIKPHGRILFDGKTVSWEPAKNWKSVALSVFERAYRNPPSRPYAAVLMEPEGTMKQASERKLVESVAEKLGVEHLVWMDQSRNSDTSRTMQSGNLVYSPRL